MSMNTHLPGRLRNTPLPRSHGLLPLFEAVVNSIHAIAEVSSDPNYGQITIEIERLPQQKLQIDEEKIKRGAPPQENIIGFKITDNGIGFNKKNMSSFETLDSDYKADQGCRGVGRLLWLKAYEAVNITSYFIDSDGVSKNRAFTFTAKNGIANETVTKFNGLKKTTQIHLSGFNKAYREKTAKTAKKIANSLFEHCLWYFVRAGGAPNIIIIDDNERIDLDDVLDEYMHSSSIKEKITLKGQDFELTHIKLNTSTVKQPFIAWCAASRVVEEENIINKVPGLYGKIKSETDDYFIYACYVTSPYLDQHVRPERIGFDIEEMSDSLFTETELSFTEIKNEILKKSSSFLKTYLDDNKIASRKRVEDFVSKRAPRYRPILRHIDEEKLSIDPGISDKDLDILLHKQLSELESSLISEGHFVMDFTENESTEDYSSRLKCYLSKVDDIKQSDLANYVFHRKVVLDILEKAIKRGPDGKYAREDLIHKIIMPMQVTSDEISSESCNLWLIDERLAFHNFLASDKPLSTMPITGCQENKEPDICALNVYDKPILVSEGQRVPLASIVIIEIKRPMRNDAAAGEEKDPVEQALGYLERIREGGAKTATGRPIPRSEEIPGYCYAICDLTPTIIKRCKNLGLTVTSDHLGYFGYNPNYKAYIEVISFDRLLNSAKERNRAFFDKLGLPTN